MEITPTTFKLFVVSGILMRKGRKGTETEREDGRKETRENG